MLLNLALDQRLFFIGVGVIAIWLVGLTILLGQLLYHYKRLTKNITKKDLKSILDEILKEKKEQAKILKQLKSELSELEKDGLTHLQKIGFLRFNPFADTGGDQSFILSLLDNQKNGIIFSSLHGRGTTRLYAKRVIKGKGKELELSQEEKKVIKQAVKLK